MMEVEETEFKILPDHQTDVVETGEKWVAVDSTGMFNFS